MSYGTDKRFDATEIINDVIGFLVPRDNGGFAVVCEKCEKTNRSAGAAPLSCKLRAVNVHPYKQTCHVCKSVLYQHSGSFTELYPAPEPSTPTSEATNPNSQGFYKWTVELEVHKTWVEDGFDLTNERAHAMLGRDLRHAYGHELKARVLTRPSDEAMAKEQGYGSDVARYRKERNR